MRLIPYHLDGTTGLFLTSGFAVIRTITESEKSNLIGVGDGVNYIESTAAYGVFLFPRPVRLDGVAYASRFANTPQYSTDTTNGVDGTWTNVGSGWYGKGTISTPAAPEDFDEALATLDTPINSVKGVRLPMNNGHLSMFLPWGEPDGGDTDRLAFWHPTLDQVFDFSTINGGTRSSGATRDLTFRAKNLSGVTKTNVTLTKAVANSTKTPPLSDQYTVDYDGGGFGALPVNIGSLAAGAISNVFTLRETIDPGADIGMDFGRFFFDAD